MGGRSAESDERSHDRDDDDDEEEEEEEAFSPDGDAQVFYYPIG